MLEFQARLSRVNLIERSHLYIGVHERSQELDDLMRELEASVQLKMNGLAQRLEQAQARLLAMNPKSVLQRGYAIVTQGPQLISSKSALENLPPGSRLAIEFGDGSTQGIWSQGETK